MELELEQAKGLESQLIEAAWRTGDLRYKLKTCQMEMYADIFKWEGFKFLIKCARRLGKTYLLLLIAVMVCLRKPRAKVRFAAPFREQLTEVLEPIMHAICADAPPHLRPVWTRGRWVFPNKSVIVPAGVNNGNIEKLRGAECDLFIVDEAGTVNDLRYLVVDVALPQFMNRDGRVVKGRRMLIASSPPKTPAHEFTEMADECETDGNYAHYDIFDAEYPDEVIQMLMKELKGPDSSTWKREALALDVVDQESAIIPEWKEEYVQEFELDEFFPFYYKYDSLDIGVRDLTVCIFAHYDFKKAQLFIHDEVVMNGPEMNTQKLAEAIRAKETTIFGEHKLRKRVSDKDLLLIQDMRMLHKLYFDPTDKGRLEEMINEVRIWVGRGRVIVHPRCVQTVGCLRYAVWNEKRSEFDRSNRFGHFDALAALMYLVRNVDQRGNPIPEDYGQKGEQWFSPAKKGNGIDRLKKMFNVR